MKNFLFSFLILIAQFSNAQTLEYNFTNPGSNDIRTTSQSKLKLDKGKYYQFKVTNVNPFVYQTTINGSKVTFEYDNSVDTLAIENFVTLPELGDILDMAKNLKILESKNKLLQAQSDPEKFLEILKRIEKKLTEIKLQPVAEYIDFYNSLGHTYNEMILACEFAKEKNGLKNSISNLYTENLKDKTKDLESNLKNSLQSATITINQIIPKIKELKGEGPALIAFIDAYITTAKTDLTEKEKEVQAKGNKATQEDFSRIELMKENIQQAIELKVKSAGINEQVNVLETSANDLNTKLQAAKNKEIVNKIDALKKMVDESEFEVVSAPFMANGDEIEIDIQIKPLDSLKYHKYNLRNEDFTVKYWVNKNSKFFISAGLGYNGFTEYSYSATSKVFNDTTFKLDPVVGYTDTIESIAEKTKYKLNEKTNQGNFGVILMTNFTYRCCRNFSIGGSVGTMIDLNKNLKYVMGVNFSFGFERRLNLHVGMCFGRRTELKSGYNTEDYYDEDLSDNLPTEKLFSKTGSYFVGLTYNLRYKPIKEALFKKDNK